MRSEINVLHKFVTSTSKNEININTTTPCSGPPPRNGVQPDVVSSIDGPEGVGVVYRHTQVWYTLHI